MEEDYNKKDRVYKVIMLVLLVAFITFMVTSLTMYTYYTKNPAYKVFTSNGSTDIESTSLPEYLDAIKDAVDEKYLWADEIDETKLKEGAIAGYVAGLGDEYTEYIPKEEMEEFTEDITGSFVGVGVYMIADESTEQIIVFYPIPESPAEEAGIKSGDIIKSVDGVEYGFEDFDTIAEKIRGEEGTKVTIVVERDGKELSFEMTRKKVNTNPVITKMLDNNIGYVSIPSFDEETAETFKSKVDDLIEKGATSLIIDLRNNGGGIVDGATEIADFLLDKDVEILTTRDNKDNKEVTKSKNKKSIDLPVVVLVNENSASASEILTGALKDNKRATVIGTKTYGKGVIQTVYSLSDGSGLKITTAEYYTPSGTAINKVGIEPDIKVELPDTVTSLYSVKEEEDTQLQRAIEELSKK